MIGERRHVSGKAGLRRASGSQVVDTASLLTEPAVVIVTFA